MRCKPGSLLAAAFFISTVAIAAGEDQPSAGAGNGKVTAEARSVVKVNRVVPYLDDSVGTTEVRQCDWNSRLIDYLVKYSKGQVEITDRDTRNMLGTSLTLVITNLHTSGGGPFSGPKWVRLRGELRQDGKVVNNFDLGSHSTVDLFRVTGCSVLNKMAKQLGGHIAKWVRKPTNNAHLGDPDEDLAPATESSLTPASSAGENQAK